ncbi:putative 20S rRNA accumulation protein 4 [Ceratocystis lukuohia]|uniref:20S rRNA accumulation protein 4 n=1 Tax=Ceratocystis lukuohia TaxID=2019550 RepID=A0ABR4MRJ1_9PEZI
MKDYDSDSDIDSQDFTETNVLLGYAQKELGDDVISHLGGTPEWIDPSTPPSATLARCKVCNDMMALLLQLDAHLPDRFPGHDRRLFVFACRKTKCRRQTGSIRALRSVRISRDAPAVIAPGGRKKDVEEKKPIETNKIVTSTGLGESLFGAKSLGGPAAGNPFGGGNPFAKPAAATATPKAKEEKETPSIAKSTDALPATFSEKLSINNPLASKPKAVPTPPEPWPTTLAKAYPVLYMDAEYETLDPEPEMKLPAHATIEKMEVEDASASSSSGGNKEDANAFESSMDATFQRFADRMAQNPDQIIRYEYAGVPLLYSDSDAVGKMLAVTGDIKGKGMPRCQNCGAGRTFEVQITPHAITELEADDMNLDGMDWGTIIVGVCEMDCQESVVEAEKVGYLEEWAGVQWEELNQE